MAVLLQGCCPVQIKLWQAWWEGLQGLFSSVPHACKESSSLLLPLSHVLGKARTPCLV